MVELGVKFGDERDPGIDVILPDTAFIEAERRNLLGIVITHAHEDHMGAVPWLWRRLRAPVYCTPFAAELLKGKLKEAGLLDEVKLNVVPMGARFDLGPFDIEYVSVTHSLPEPNARWRSALTSARSSTPATGRSTGSRPFRLNSTKRACARSARRACSRW
jgi:ribonuclease J